MDDFIDDDLSDELGKLDLNQNSQNKKKNKNKKNPYTKQYVEELEEKRRWLTDKQMDVFIENLFLVLNVTETYEEAFYQVRKAAMQAVHLKPTVDYRRLNPIYPKF